MVFMTKVGRIEHMYTLLRVCICMDKRSNVRSINEKYDLVLSEREHEHEREHLSNV